MSERVLVLIEIQCESSDDAREKTSAVLDAVSKYEDLDVGKMKAHLAIRETADRIMSALQEGTE